MCLNVENVMLCESERNESVKKAIVNTDII